MSDTTNTSTIDTMARTLWGEARGEGLAGMVAVAHVILNRAAHPSWWGHNVTEVCMKPFQFSCWLVSDPNRDKLLIAAESDPAFADAMTVATRAVNGHIGRDITNGATHYFANSIPAPAWATTMKPVAIIGNHNFFRST